jgi:hypothetical protein
MPTKGRKDVLVDFPAKLILDVGHDGLGYPRIAPKIREFVICHSWTPQGGCHARAFENRRPVKDYEILPESCMKYVDVVAGETVRMSSPLTAATASIAPTDFDTFGGLVAFRDRQTGDLLIKAVNSGRMTVVFWGKGVGPRDYKPIGTEASFL